jgi:hypothetical protein
MKNYFTTALYIFTLIYLGLGAAFFANHIGNKIYNAPPKLHTFNNCLYYYFNTKGEIVHLPGKGRGMFEFAPSDQECGD